MAMLNNRMAMIIFFFKIATRRSSMVLAICRQGLEIQNIPDRIPPLFFIADANSVQHFALHRLHRYTGCTGYTRYTDYIRLHRYTGCTDIPVTPIPVTPCQGISVSEIVQILVRQLDHFCHINQPFSMPLSCRLGGL